MLNNTERLEKVLFQGGTFSVKNVVLLGNKTATGNRLDPIYTREYNSTKYNNLNTLKVTRFNQNEYVVFGVNDFENKINEEIFCSYPHMLGLVTFIEECYNLLNTQGVFTNNSVASQYQDTAIESDPMASGKKMIAVPAVWDGKDNEVKKGILLFLGSEDVCVQLDASVVASLGYMLSNFNLSISSSQLLMMGMIEELSSLRGGSQAPSNGFKSNTGFTGGNNITPKRGLFGNSNGNRRAPLGGGMRANQPTEPVQEPVEENNFEPAPQAGKKKLSMNNIKQVASEIDVEDLGDVEI